jgi:hypothetical protein
MVNGTHVDRAAWLLAGFMCSGGLAACGSGAASTMAGTGALPSASAATAEGAPQVVRTVRYEADLKEDYLLLAELAASPKVVLVVAGEVTETMPLYEEQAAYTKLTVKVTKSRSAAVPVGSSIVIYRDGGLIPLKSIPPDLKSNGQKLSSPPANAVVDFSFMGAPQSKVGDDIVAFLQKNPNPGRADSYQLVSSVHGLFTLDKKAGKYHRSGEGDRPGFEASASVANTESYAEHKK